MLPSGGPEVEDDGPEVEDDGLDRNLEKGCLKVHKNDNCLGSDFEFCTLFHC
jgi:hypothetical protein